MNTYFTNMSRVHMVENLWYNNTGSNVISRMLQFTRLLRILELPRVRRIIVLCCNNARQEFVAVDTTAKLWQSIPRELLCVTRNGFFKASDCSTNTMSVSQNRFVNGWLSRYNYKRLFPPNPANSFYSFNTLISKKKKTRIFYLKNDIIKFNPFKFNSNYSDFYKRFILELNFLLCVYVLCERWQSNKFFH